VAGEHDPGRPAEVGPGQDGVADPLHLQAAETAQRRLDRVGEVVLRPGHRGGVDQGSGEREDVVGQVERRQGAHEVRA
jgi:hypothetical protein